ncbi:LLM class flavin-dependent oxidoreductase [Streptomyces sp. NPDC048595]|uniref:LLM class flavin-dependent oxidoreductase n=1 Tax=Streptomyces sp. NPDC048595 TaxID=3365576 RepID=UPI00371154F0
MPTKELWTLGSPHPTQCAGVAEQAEAEGFDGIVFPDSQGIGGDPYVAMAIAAHVTDRIQLGTGVTNPYTRHPAVAAGAIASIQAESGGRAVLGIGRGNSALAFLGLAPVPLGMFERYLARVQGYLRGDGVEMDRPAEGMRSSKSLALGTAPPTSRLQWLPRPEPKVPVDVAATGPKVIDLAARLGDRITFTVGGEEERIRWAVDTARAARRQAGLDPDEMSLGCFVNIVAHPDIHTARDLVSGFVTVMSRYAVLHGETTGPLSDDNKKVLRDIRDSYDMTKHTRAGTAQASVLTDNFIDSYAVVGPPKDCVARLEALFACGLDRIILIHGSPGADEAEMAKARRYLVEEVVPALR